MIKGQLSDRLSNLGVLGVLSANPFRAEESTRAKLAKDAKLKASSLMRLHAQIKGQVRMALT